MPRNLDAVREEAHCEVMQRKNTNPSGQHQQLSYQDVRDRLIQLKRYFNGEFKDLDEWFDRTLAVIERAQKKTTSTARAARRTRQSD